jgi:uncharacterized protein
MKVSETDILIVPGQSNSGPRHWQSRWQAKLSTARRVEQADWERPGPEAWIESVAKAVNEADRPVVLVAHSLGVAAVVQAVSAYERRVAGAFLVAPPDLENAVMGPEWLAAFGPYPRDPLPFPSLLIASRNDPWCAFGIAEDLAATWGSLLINAGDAGHINTDSGYGPWPEGSMAFAQFLSRLS